MAGPEADVQVDVRLGAAGARPRLREPGLAGFAPGTERYRVAGGASLVVALQPGDRLTVTDIEGRQPCEVVAFDAQVGVVTSATRSPMLGKNIALCRMDVNYAGLGSEVEVGKIDGHQKRIPATVVRFPFYDPDKTRVRS
jgi:glycine cleavage system aminomethyltransferase T